jgi:hypothetical protein
MPDAEQKMIYLALSETAAKQVRQVLAAEALMGENGSSEVEMLDAVLATIDEQLLPARARTKKS